MASNRHLGRIVALQTIYEYEFRTQVGDQSVSVGEILERNLGKYKSSVDDTEFVSSLTQGVIDHISELDDKLRPLAPEWPIEQVARVDRTVLRLGLYELLFSADSVPPKVAINEAVELAKKYCNEKAAPFINGVLSKIGQDMDEE